VLLWRALLDDRAGILNRTFGWSVPWLDEAGSRSLWPYVSILLVNLWLAYPYVFLVASRALRALPAELVDAARLEGATGLGGFRRVTFPLLLPVIAPVLVAAFAFNVASFTLVHLLSAGIGAASPLVRTDLLVNAAWRLAFDTAGGPQLGLAAAVSIVVFIVVALVSAVGVGLARPAEVSR
jgi:ABC-type sugar transport system permease subunit